MKRKHFYIFAGLTVFIMTAGYLLQVKSKNDFEKAVKFETRAYYPEAVTYYLKALKNLFASKNLKEDALSKIAFLTDEKILDRKRAAEYFEEYCNRFPKGKYLEECMYRAGYNNLLFTGNLEKAILFFEKFTVRFPGSKWFGPVHSMLGDVYRKKHNYKRAIEINLGSIEKKLPGIDSDYLHLMNAEMYYRLGNNPAGLAEIGKIKNKNSNMVKYNIFYNLFLTLKYPKDHSKYLGLAQAYRKNGLPEKADEIMKRASRKASVPAH